MSRKKQTAKPETSRADKPKDRTGIYIAVIGLLGTITAAIIGNINVRTQFKLPVMATQTAEARAESTLFSATNPSTAFPSSISTTSTNGPPSIMPVLSITGALSTPSLALSTSTTLGVLSIKVLEGCGIHIFDINRDGQIVGSSKTDQREYLTEGTYDIFLKSDFGKDLARTGVLVQRGKETVVDFSGEMGALLLSSYPQFKMLLPYKVYNNNNSARGFLYSNSYFCGSPDKYGSGERVGKIGG